MYVLIFNILLWISTFELTHQLYQMDPDFGLTTEERIKKYNYPFEKHTLQTEDGYILEIHRIPNTKYKNSIKNIPPVLIYSGLLGDSSTWTALGPKRGLGFILADNGYDVWMGNNRGSTLCKKHISLDPYKDKKKFWDFSFQELGYFDVPATIDHILNITKQEKLLYIGYSQGSASYFSMLSDKPIYNNKIKFNIAIAPAISIQNSLSYYVRLLIQNLKTVTKLMESLDMYELLPHSQSLIKVFVDYCSPNSTYQHFCARLLCTVFGATMEQINMTALPLLFTSNPAGGSMKEGFHFLQLNSGVFRKYDHGKKENLKRYGQKYPPIYNLSEAIVPTAIIYGNYDKLTSQKDIELLVPKLSNVVGMKMIPKFNHLDLAFGMDAPRLVFPKILKYLRMYR